MLIYKISISITKKGINNGMPLQTLHERIAIMLLAPERLTRVLVFIIQCVYTYIYIYIYIERERERGRVRDVYIYIYIYVERERDLCLLVCANNNIYITDNEYALICSIIIAILVCSITYIHAYNCTGLTRVLRSVLWLSDRSATLCTRVSRRSA